MHQVLFKCIVKKKRYLKYGFIIKSMKNEDGEVITIDLLQKKAKYFFENTLVVHVTMKLDNEEHITSGTRYYNGTIQELSDDFIILKDRVLGMMPIFFQQVKDIRLFTIETNGDKKDGRK